MSLWYRRATPTVRIRRQQLFGLSESGGPAVLMRKTIFRNLRFLGLTTLILALLGASCLPKPPGERGDITITLYGFSVMKESLEKAIFPAFAAKWKQQHGQVLMFQSSFA